MKITSSIARKSVNQSKSMNQKNMAINQTTETSLDIHNSNAQPSSLTVNQKLQGGLNQNQNNIISQQLFENQAIGSTLDSQLTENLHRVYDVDEGEYRDIRDDEICSIDSTAFFDKRAGKKFTLLPRSSTVQSKFWSLFWNRKDKANNNLIKAAKDGNNKKILKLLNRLKKPEKIADIHFCDTQGLSALHTASKYNQYEALRLLILSGDANINMPTMNELRQTSLHIAAIEQHILLVKSLIQEFNADVNCQDGQLNTPLHYAVQTNNHRLVKMILESNANLELTNMQNQKVNDLQMRQNIKQELQQYERRKLRKLSDGASSQGNRVRPTSKEISVQEKQSLYSKQSLKLTNKKEEERLGLLIQDTSNEKIRTKSKNAQQLTKLDDALKKIDFKGPKQSQNLENLIQDLNSPNLNEQDTLQNSGEHSYQDEIDQDLRLEEDYLRRIKETEKLREELKKQIQDQNSPKPQVKQKTTIYNFIPIAKLGEGSYGQVYLVEEIDSRKRYAMKMLDKKKIIESDLLRYTVTEKEILQKADHPFVVKLFYAFQTMRYFFLIQEFCPCGDMSKLLTKKKRLTEDEARLYIAEVILAIEYLHSQNIIYRDLKPDNIIIDSDGHLKLTDFGLSKENVDSECHSNSFVGSYAYAAPEIIKHKAHGKSLDWYGVGVLLYEFLVGVPPYYDRDQEKMFNNIVNGTIKIPLMLSYNAQDLIQKLLKRNPLERLGANINGAQEIKDHPFFSGLNWDDVINKTVQPEFNKKKIVRTEKIPIQAYIEMIGETSENRYENWSFIRE
ncbi:protein kinase domain containing protein [Stylonychia lemnae]|uniref:Protein kinase domain containing protein n=1 Tax=Stylonychia lemnae TaxID=5949 RepID=A0A078B812_STYLE|nr:protein kinase domain containing protein [Stylonychia lemnae]|eukprot:CDW90361.1 protein kinase domain containing protein [Stylonychia lemnae]